MKAWIVRRRDGDYATVVFAETRGKARALAQTTDCCEDEEFTNVSAKRFREADSHYRGRSEMDWYDPQDRLFLVKAGWHCEYTDLFECADCCAKAYCDKMLEETDEEHHTD